jgi:hypothetical protein
MGKITELFWGIMQQASNGNFLSKFLDNTLVDGTDELSERSVKITITRSVITYKSSAIIYFAAEA